MYEDIDGIKPRPLSPTFPHTVPSLRSPRNTLNHLIELTNKEVNDIRRTCQGSLYNSNKKFLSKLINLKTKRCLFL